MIIVNIRHPADLDRLACTLTEKLTHESYAQLTKPDLRKLCERKGIACDLHETKEMLIEKLTGATA